MAWDELPGRYLQAEGSAMLYKRGRLLGEGTFGRCYLLTEVASGRVYAAKVLPRAQLRVPGVMERVERERELQGSLSHRHIVRLHGHFATRGHTVLLLELCSHGSLADILRARGTLMGPEVRYYLRQVIAGLQYLHGHGIAHRDLKPSNLLVTWRMQVKIGDLGLAREVTAGSRRWGVLCGTPSFLPPEVLQRRGHGLPSDVWALGCVMYMVLVGSPPFVAANRQELNRRIRAARYPLPPQLSPRARALLTLLLAPEPTARPSLGAVLEHGFFTQGFTPDTLPPRACRTVPVSILLQGAATALARRWLGQEQRAPALRAPGNPGGAPAPPDGADSERRAEPRSHPLGKTFISARNRLKSNH